MRILSLIRRAPKLTSALLLMITAVVIIPLALHAWGPSRPTYTLAHPADHITFNSITDNPNIGDERNFVGIREAGTSGLWQDNVTVEPGKEYSVRMYVHNNAASSLNLVAENVKARFDLPSTVAKSIEVNGFISSTNATPTQVWDQATFNNSQDFSISYVSNTLRYYNNAFGPSGVVIPENIFTSAGTPIGYEQLDGRIPGCFQYSGYLTFTVKPQFQHFDTSKQVRKAGDTTWLESVNASIGDTLEYQIRYQNTGETPVDNVIVKDYLPQGLTYVNGSTYLKNGNFPTPKNVSDNLFANSGINIGGYNPGAAAYLKFSVKVVGTESMVCGPNTFVNKERTTVNSEYKEDTANAVVNKTCINECKPGIPVGDVRCTPPKECKPGIPEGDTRCYELPHTGPVNSIVAFLGLGALIASIAYYVASRRARA